MHERNQFGDESVTTGVWAVAVLAGALVAAAHPVGVGFALLVVTATTLVGRAVWQQLTTGGLGLPGTNGKLRVETQTARGQRQRWVLTVSIVER